MSKYIIELEDDIKYIIINGRADNRCYTLVRPIAELEELNSDYINEHYGELQDEAFDRGLTEAWELSRAIWHDECGERSKLGCVSIQGVFDKYTAQEAIAKLKAYEDKRFDRIEVGDEVIAPCGKAVVTLIETDDLVHYLYSGGDYGCIEPQKLKKTGKHYDIASILEAMRNDR